MDRSAFLKAHQSIPVRHEYLERNGIGSYRLPLLAAQSGIDHGFSTREGGVSTGCFSSLNLSFTRPEQAENVMENYRIFSRAMDIPWESMVMDAYEHGTTVLRVDVTDCGRGYLKEPLPACDGLVTNDPCVTLITGHADCMAFYFYDPVKRAIGLCHAGWRGALHRIGAEVVRRMQKEYGSDPKDILAGVGPSICPGCFEVGDDVAEAFEAAFPLCALRGTNARGRAIVDLWQVATCQMLESGLLPEHIELMGVCTVEEKRLYSHRGDHGRTGGMAAYLRIMKNG